MLLLDALRRAPGGIPAAWELRQGQGEDACLGSEHAVCSVPPQHIPVGIAQRLCLVPAAATYNPLSPCNPCSDDEHLPEQTIPEVTPKALQPLIWHP